MTHLITGYAGTEHIQSADAGAFNAAFFGGGQYVMESGNQFGGSIIDNNTVRILDGDLLMYGRHVRIEPNTYEDLTIATGTAGKSRTDLICMTYEKDTSDGTEKSYLQVIKGEETAGTVAAPAYTDGNILDGASFNQMPLYKVSVEGVVLKSIVPMFAVIPTYKTLAEQYAAQFEATINALKSANILDSMEEVEANKLENMIAGALAMKEHSMNKENPHTVTKAQVGLDKVDNTDDANKPISNAAKTKFNQVDKSIEQVDANFEQFTTRMDGLTIRDIGEQTLNFVNGEYVFTTTALASESGHMQLRGVIINGFGTGHHFTASISDADPADITLTLKCISDATLNGEQKVSILLITSQVLPEIIVT